MVTKKGTIYLNKPAAFSWSWKAAGLCKYVWPFCFHQPLKGKKQFILQVALFWSSLFFYFCAVFKFSCFDKFNLFQCHDFFFGLGYLFICRPCCTRTSHTRIIQCDEYLSTSWKNGELFRVLFIYKGVISTSNVKVDITWKCVYHHFFCQQWHTAAKEFEPTTT